MLHPFAAIVPHRRRRSATGWKPLAHTRLSAGAPGRDIQTQRRRFTWYHAHVAPAARCTAGQRQAHSYPHCDACSITLNSLLLIARKAVCCRGRACAKPRTTGRFSGLRSSPTGSSDRHFRHVLVTRCLRSPYAAADQSVAQASLACRSHLLHPPNIIIVASPWAPQTRQRCCALSHCFCGSRAQAGSCLTRSNASWGLRLERDG